MYSLISHLKETPAVWTAASGLIVSRLCFQRALHRVRLHSSSCVFEQGSDTSGRESFAPSQRNAIALCSNTTSHARPIQSARVSLSSFIYKYPSHKPRHLHSTALSQGHGRGSNIRISINKQIEIAFFAAWSSVLNPFDLTLQFMHEARWRMSLGKSMWP